MLSPYAKSIADKHELTSGKSSKLIASMNNKTKYVIHEMNLKQAVDAGLILTKIHRIIEFKQKPWMKDFIDFNINKRKESKNEFEERILQNYVQCYVWSNIDEFEEASEYFTHK